MRLLLLPILSAFLFSQDVTRVSEFKTSAFRGIDCDDTEYRNSNGRPNWKNYGQWLSECDSISSVTIDAEFAIKRKKKQEEERLEYKEAFWKLREECFTRWGALLFYPSECNDPYYLQTLLDSLYSVGIDINSP